MFPAIVQAILHSAIVQVILFLFSLSLETFINIQL